MSILFNSFRQCVNAHWLINLFLREIIYILKWWTKNIINWILVNRKRSNSLTSFENINVYTIKKQKNTWTLSSSREFMKKLARQSTNQVSIFQCVMIAEPARAGNQLHRLCWSSPWTRREYRMLFDLNFVLGSPEYLRNSCRQAMIQHHSNCIGLALKFWIRVESCGGCTLPWLHSRYCLVSMLSAGETRESMQPLCRMYFPCFVVRGCVDNCKWPLSFPREIVVADMASSYFPSTKTLHRRVLHAVILFLSLAVRLVAECQRFRLLLPVRMRISQICLRKEFSVLIAIPKRRQKLIKKIEYYQRHLQCHTNPHQWPCTCNPHLLMPLKQ